MCFLQPLLHRPHLAEYGLQHHEPLQHHSLSADDPHHPHSLQDYDPNNSVFESPGSTYPSGAPRAIFDDEGDPAAAAGQNSEAPPPPLMKRTSRPSLGSTESRGLLILFLSSLLLRLLQLLHESSLFLLTQLDCVRPDLF